MEDTSNQTSYAARLSRIEADIACLNAKMDNLLTLQEKVEHHEKELFGNGKPGVVIEIDRLIQAIDGFKKVGWAITGALITTGIVFIINAVIHAATTSP